VISKLWAEGLWVPKIFRNVLQRSILSHIYNITEIVGFEVLTAVGVMKISVFSDLTPCSPLKVNRRFGRTCHLCLQGRSQARNQRDAGRKQILNKAGCGGLGKDRGDAVRV
jgi:hypothetical protein